MLIQQKRNARLARALNAMQSKQTQEVDAEVQNESLDQNGIIIAPAIELQVLFIPSFPSNTARCDSLLLVIEPPTHSRSSPLGLLLAVVAVDPCPNYSC